MVRNEDLEYTTIIKTKSGNFEQPPLSPLEKRVMPLPARHISSTEKVKGFAKYLETSCAIG
jgi:hypothetical protein